ncbi:MAG TPA: DUF692 family protein [Nitrospira sp.]|nr:DUF692 family protein [Nitrospira sp.]
MAIFGSVGQAFQCRVANIPRLDLGLSVDVYSPDLFELMHRFLREEHRPAYLEIFRANQTVLRSVRQHISAVPLTYHGEGLWVTQPDFPLMPYLEQDLDDVAAQLTILGSPWLNHECATKQMAGYSFGTYLPPLFTAESARVVAENIALVQEKMDQVRQPDQEFGPLFVLEMPPLTYFMAGTMSVPEFFDLVTELVPCGLVLDIGHLWTVYRYTAVGQQLSLERFVDRFLDEFPLERVIEVHVAGLSQHPLAPPHRERGAQPEWLDAHDAPIQPVCWRMLEQVLVHPRLVNLRGVALEVDTKPIEHIVEEFREATLQFGALVRRRLHQDSTAGISVLKRAESCLEQKFGSEIDRRRLQADYARYARIATGQQSPTGPEWQAVADAPAGLNRYIHEYLPHEILHWGGDIAEMFTETWRGMHEEGNSLEDFVLWWFQQPRSVDRPYDFFLLKIDRMLEFVVEREPGLLTVAEREASMLRTAYADANQTVQPIMEPTR